MKNLATLFILLFTSLSLSATHFRASSVEIQFEQTGPLDVSASIVMYVLEEFRDDFRDSLQLAWGDGQINKVLITNGPDTNGDGMPDGELAEPGVYKLVFSGDHTYASLGRYVLSVFDPNRSSGIMNLNFPNSVSIPFYTESEINLIADFERNHSPVLLEGGGDYMIAGQNALQLPNAFDIDDDSLVYELVVPQMDAGIPVPNYFGIGNIATIDSDKGILTFNTELAGDFVFAIQITSYRNGEVQDRVIRDMTFFNSQPGLPNAAPVLNVSTTLEVVQEVSIGDTVRFECSLSDAPGQVLQLTSSSGLYDYFDNPATFTVDQNTATFEWIVRPEHLRTHPYPVVVKGKDDYEDLGSANYALVRYRVKAGTVSTNDITSNKWVLYPNPTHDQLHLRAPDFEVKLPVRYTLVSTMGQLVDRGLIRSWPAGITVAELPAGSYLLRLESDNEWWFEQFVKQ